jgi:serine/threonine protein kinase
MSARRVSAAPDLPGFTFVEVIGSGGYADVFLYEQLMPRRHVAVKVLDASLLPADAASDYTEEANVMAMVSEHPYIVQVFQADISPDGRPYLVMEYYPGLDFQQRAKQEQMAVAEVLKVGIQIACAVDTAHDAGILHRDIKPANILTSKFRKPGLTDFGIAAVDGPDESSSDSGLSIPWAPPEALGEVVSDRRADVYSLAATCYTMLAGRSPFEIPSGDNRPLALMNRIERDRVPSIGRADVPERLERVLAGAMSKDPAHRPGRAVDFARQLQAIESELHLPVTELEIAGMGTEVRERSIDTDGDATRAKQIVQINAQETASPPAPTRAPIHSGAVGDMKSSQAPSTLKPRRREGLLAEPEIEHTVVRSAPETQELDQYESESGPSKISIAAFGAACLVALVVGIIVLTGGGESNPEVDTAENVVEINDNFGEETGAPVAVTPLPIDDIVGEQLDSGSFEFTWSSQGSDVTYAIRVGDESFTTEITETTYVSSEPCIEVETIATSGLISAPTRGCVQE